MKKTVLTLEEAFRTGVVKVGDYIDYQPTPATCTISKGRTGFEKKQTFSTEHLRWKLIEFKGQLIFVSDIPTIQTLTLRGKIGYKNENEIINKLCEKLYSNSMFSEKVCSLTKKIENEAYLVLKHGTKLTYWLPSLDEDDEDDDDEILSLLCMIGNQESFSIMASSNPIFGEEEYTDDCGIRPMVFPKSDIQINLESGNGKVDSPWGICRYSDTMLELMQLIQEGEQAIQEGNKLLKRAKKLLEKM